ncbi:MAG: FliA/WhiG family RNA polymerase sigma factor [Rubrobacter sp.]|nr:FliA/WhiG family RNA polymerase sigma factor [Rubrobacter sp.]
MSEVALGRERTIGRLWEQYLKARGELYAAEQRDGEGRMPRSLERRTEGFRDRLVVNYSPLVKYAAGRIYARSTSSLDQEDLYSWGVLGLLDAIETYDPDRKAKFESYAISKIRWAILDELRREDWVPRRVRLRAQEIERARARLGQELRRQPSEREISKEVGMTFEEYQSFLDQYARAQVSSLESRLDIDGGLGAEFQAFVVDHGVRDPQSEAEKEDLRTQLAGAIEELGHQERLVTTFYFYEGLTLKEIGKAMSLTEGRISQILRRALRRLQANLSERPIASWGR